MYISYNLIKITYLFNFMYLQVFTQNCVSLGIDRSYNFCWQTDDGCSLEICSEDKLCLALNKTLLENTTSIDAI